MPPVPYQLLRPLLFRLDPETAHELSLQALGAMQHTPLQALWRAPRVADPIRLGPLQFPNRVGLAAGLDKNARCIDALGAMGFGFVEVGTVTPQPQEGNPRPRIFRLPQAQALINRMGFNNHGLDAFIANVRASRWYQARSKNLHVADQPMLLGLNIGKNASTPMEHASTDYTQALEAVYPYADYVTVNISSPNTQNLRSLQGDAALEALLSELEQRRDILARQYGQRKPIYIKIAPDMDAQQLQALAHVLLHFATRCHGPIAQDWGVIATNTTLSRTAVQGLEHAQEAGGLSGAPLARRSNEVIAQLRSMLGPDFPIIGVGGIHSTQDAVDKVRAGADVVQLYTGLIYQGPALVAQCAQGIKNEAPRRAYHAP